MKIHARKHWLLLAALFAAGSAYAGPKPSTGKASVVLPPSFIDKVATAPSRLGPCIIRCTTETWTPGHSKPFRFDYVTRFNDPTHFLSKVQYGGPGAVYANGKDWILVALGSQTHPKQVYYTKLKPSANARPGGPPSPDDLGTDLGWFQRDVSRKLKTAKSRRVTVAVMDGVPVYRITYRLARGSVEVDIGQRDHLVRLWHAASERTAYRETYSYSGQSKPFPPSTFVFTPPPGAILQKM